MKAKIFSGLPDDVEGQLNRWFRFNAEKYAVTEALQSQSLTRSGNIRVAVTIFYTPLTERIGKEMPGAAMHPPGKLETWP
jgi:hypothetical protein